MKGRILLIEDDEHIARILCLELEHEQYETGVAANGRLGVELALGESWDLILLDIMLPELNGMEVLRRIRQSGSQVPVIMLTARDSTPDKVSGFEQGANDYVAKPFAIEELLARIRNLLQLTRKPDEEKPVYQALDLTIETKARKVTRGSNTIELTPKEFELLVYLVGHQGQVLSREEIISNVWGYDFIGDTNIVDVYIRYLRQKIDKGYAKKLIQTARGVGYYIGAS